MSNEGSEIGSFGYGFKVIRYADGSVEFDPTVIIMQMQVFLDDLKKEYRDKHGRKPSSGEE